MLKILIPSFNRLGILSQTISRIRKATKSGEILVGDDGDTPEQTKTVVESLGATYISGPRRGLGANLNNLLQQVNESDIILQMDDDHWINGPMDLQPYIDFLKEEETCGWIRLMFGGYAGRKLDPKTYYHFRGDLWGRFWRIDWHSPEAYLTSNRPHLKKLDFHKYFGFYKEGVKLGETEYEFCMRCKTRAMQEGSPYNVFIPLYPPPEEAWLHASELGEGKSDLSWQLKGY